MGNSTDAMISRIEKEVAERNAFIEGVIESAQDASRDLTQNEKELTAEARKRIEACEEQLESLYESRERTMKARERSEQVHRELSRMRNEIDAGPVEYRSAGAYVIDVWQSSMGNREAAQRLDVFMRAAAHQKTPDNLGTIPDPIVGEVINFIDAARPIVSQLGPRPLTSATWHRPKVTQHTAVAAQGVAGAAADEKAELTSQKMLITRLTGNAQTFGGYVNISRQNIDFSQPGIMDTVINDLAAQYAIETEASVAAALATTTTPGEGYGTVGTETDTTIANAVWDAAATVYTATRGMGRLVLAVAPDRLSIFGRLFAPVNPRDAHSEGFTAGRFGQGEMGTISGVPVVMSSGLAAGEAFLFSTSAMEVFEQRVGSLQVVEPSVLGVQVAYAGYFTPLKIEDGGIVPLTATVPA